MNRQGFTVETKFLSGNTPKTIHDNTARLGTRMINIGDQPFQYLSAVTFHEPIVLGDSLIARIQAFLDSSQKQLVQARMVQVSNH